MDVQVLMDGWGRVRCGGTFSLSTDGPFIRSQGRGRSVGVCGGGSGRVNERNVV